MKKQITFLIILLFLVSGFSFVFAEDSQDVCQQIISELNLEKGIQLPNYVPYKNEIFNIYLSDESIGHMKIEDKVIVSIGCEESENPTYNIYVRDMDIIEDIKNSEKPIEEFNNKLKNKDIVLEGTSVGKKIKGLFTRLGIMIASWFV